MREVNETRGDREAPELFWGLFEGLFGLNSEADGDLGRTVENLKDVIAEQATELALGSRSGSQLDAAVARVTFRTGDVGLSHAPGICRACERFSSPPVCHDQLTNDSTACPAISTIDLDVQQRAPCG
jgi:hypothetical protein